MKFLHIREGIVSFKTRGRIGQMCLVDIVRMSTLYTPFVASILLKIDHSKDQFCLLLLPHFILCVCLSRVSWQVIQL